MIIKSIRLIRALYPLFIILCIFYTGLQPNQALGANAQSQNRITQIDKNSETERKKTGSEQVFADVIQNNDRQYLKISKSLMIVSILFVSIIFLGLIKKNRQLSYKINNYRQKNQDTFDSKIKYRQLFDNSLSLIGLFGEDGMCQAINRICASYFGGTPKDFVSRSLADFFPKSKEKMIPLIRKVAESGVAEYYETLVEFHLGKRWLSIVILPINNNGETERSVKIVAQDITEQKKTSQNLKESEEMFRLISEQSLASIFIIQHDGVKYANKASEDLCGLSVDKITKASLDDICALVHKEDLDFVLDKYKTEHQNKSGSCYQYRSIPVLGPEKIVEQYTKSIMYKGRAAFLVSAFDVTERNRAEKVLKKSGEKFRRMIVQAPYPIIITNPNQDIDYFNDEFTRIFGYTTQDVSTTKVWWGKAYPDLKYREKVRKKWRESIKESLATRIKMKPQEWIITCKDGSKKIVEFRMVPIDDIFLIVLNDLTEKRKTQEMMMQTEKMMSVGALAAGMAHEINNPLGGIMQGAQNILRRISTDMAANVEVADECGIDLDKMNIYLEKRKILRFIQGIRDSGDRAAKIVSNMLQFSRRSESKMAPRQLFQLVRKTVELANNDYDLKKKYDFRHLKIVEEFDPSMKEVNCSETEIEQVILNLLRNAAQSMTKTDSEPHIIIRLYAEGDLAVIEIEDNGPGMDETTRKRVFEPFFTTKPVGEGTGIGLSVSYMIISNNHKGTMEVESEPGKGACFIVKLPFQREGFRKSKIA